VLPFSVIDAGDGAVPAYVSDGLTESLINALSHLAGLQVIDRNASFHFREAPADVTELAARLGVDALLVGAIQRGDGQYRVTARLLNGSDGVVLWSDEFQHPVTDLRAFEVEIGHALARELGLDPGSDRLAGVVPGSTTSNVAHSYYLQGLYLLNLRRIEDMRRAIDYLELALAEDPEFGLAYATLAQASLLMTSNRDMPAAESRRRAADLAGRALAIDERIASAHSALAAAHQADGNRAAAERSYLRALELNPSDALSRSWYGMLLLYSGRTTDGIRQLEVAYQLDPISIGVSANLAWGYYFDRRHAAALAVFERVLRRDSTLFPMHNGRGRALQQIGRAEEAIAAYSRAVELGGTPHGRAFLAQALARHGRAAEARSIRAELASNETIDPLVLAIVDVGLGDMDQAVAGLEAAAAGPSYGLVQVRFDAVFDPIRTDPRYPRLLKLIDPGRNDPVRAP
jgi:TolB-like protein/tetratricopeptide (TPR) repeat protein